MEANDQAGPRLEIVLGAHVLDWWGGSVTCTVTVARELARLGHRVTIFSPRVGEPGRVARGWGLDVVDDERALPETCGVVYAQDAWSAFALGARYPETPVVACIHGDETDVFFPPQLRGLVSATVAMYDRVEARARALAGDVPVVRLAQPVDLRRFVPHGPLADPPRRALALGNYLRGDRREQLAAACHDVGLELSFVGVHDQSSTATEHVLNTTDIVIGKARVMVEAMACGRAAYVYDHNGGDGWITPETYERHAADNFAGQSTREVVDASRLRRDLAEYRPEMGPANRDLAVLHHSAARHAHELVTLFRTLAPRTEPAPDSLAEMARLTALQWDTYVRLDAAQYWGAEALKENRRIDDERVAAVAAADDLKRERDELAAEVARRRGEWDALLATRRYRFARALARPLDALRRRR
ncbi:MAG: hypothetical protein QOG35_824 [Solirubrobacteraceae bacterium]|jgi:hypothetical protein|nr:hypothetical protein [Solirubrobacteraceae bacterium]